MSSFVIFFNTDRLPKRKLGDIYKDIQILSVHTEHAQTVCTRPFLFLGGACMGTRLYRIKLAVSVEATETAGNNESNK